MIGKKRSKRTGNSLLCSVENCDRKHLARNLCSMHYHRWQRYGDPNFVKYVSGPGNTPEERFWAKVDKSQGLGPQGTCWEWTHDLDIGGYGRLWFGNDEEKAHRVAWFLVKGEKPKGVLRHFICDNRKCCNTDHLRDGTQKENIQDAMDRDRNPKGERHGCSKLTEKDVLEIRSRYAAGETQTALGKEFGCTQANISLIVKRLKWSHI